MRRHRLRRPESGGEGGNEAPDEARARFRDLGFSIGRLPTGPLNAITDVAGVTVGHHTRLDGNEPGPDGRGPFNTGVTAILPHPGDLYRERVPAAVSVLNGSGEVFGREFVDEMGMLDSPIMLTGSFNVARVADAVIAESCRRNAEIGRGGLYVHPFVAECSDSRLSDLVARPMGESEAASAWGAASGGFVEEGSVGAGTGLVSYQFKGGIGTSSRLAEVAGRARTVGVLVSTNTGVREELVIDGVPVGLELTEAKPTWVQQGSINMVVATDAPMLQPQLSRLGRRAHLGLARTGARAHGGSGDFSIAFSTGNRYLQGEGVHELRDVDNDSISPLFDATVEATEEAIVNALCTARSFVGRDGHWAPELPSPALLAVMERHGRPPRSGAARNAGPNGAGSGTGSVQ